MVLALVAGCAAPPGTSGPRDPSRLAAAGPGSPPGSRPASFAGATAFLPPNYECELFADYAAMRELGLLDELERLPGMDDFLSAIGGSYFSELDQIDRTRTAMVFDWSGSRPTNREVSVAEGRDLHPPAEVPAGCARVHIGRFDAVQVTEGPTSRPTAIWPSSSIVVVGGHDLLEPVLRGERAGGVPHSDLLPLVPGNGILMQAVICSLHGRSRMPFDDAFFLLTGPGKDAAADIEAGRLRLGADSDERLNLSVTLRFVQGSTRVAAFAQGWRDQLAEWGRAAAPAVRKVLTDVSVRQDGRDVDIAIDLGTLRQAITKVQNVALAMMAAQSRRP